MMFLYQISEQNKFISEQLKINIMNKQKYLQVNKILNIISIMFFTFSYGYLIIYSIIRLITNN